MLGILKESEVAWSCPTVCDPTECSLLGSSIHGIFQARILKWVAMPSSRGPLWPRAWTHFPCISCTAHRFFTSEPPGNLCKICVLVTQSCPTLCDPIHYSPPGSSNHGISQARILGWIAISFSRRSSQTRDWTSVSRIVGRCFTIWWLKSLSFSTVLESFYMVLTAEQLIFSHGVLGL